jgi:hypothetical protein
MTKQSEVRFYSSISLGFNLPAGSSKEADNLSFTPPPSPPKNFVTRL